MKKSVKNILSLTLAVLLLVGLFPATALASEEIEAQRLNFPFIDVSISDWFFPAVVFAHDNNVMAGNSSTNFAPNEQFSRAQVAATLFRIYHGRLANASDSRTTSFTDVPNAEWYAPYVSWAERNGIVEGLPGNRFAPRDSVNRQQFATMLFRYAERMTDMDTSVRQGLQWASFSDRAQIQNWALPALTWANYHGFVQGRTSTTIAPDHTATRAEAAIMLGRFMGGNVEPLPPQRIDISGLLGTNFSSVRYRFGHFAAMVDHHLWTMYRFQSGILVGVDGNGRIRSLQVDFAHHSGNITFHYRGIDLNATRDNVRALLGAPTVSDGVSYAYWVNDEIQVGAVRNFNFDSLRLDRVSTIFFSYMN